MGDLIATTATNPKGLGSSSKGPQAVVVVKVKKPKMTEEQKLKCKRKKIEAAQYASMGITPPCGN